MISFRNIENSFTVFIATLSIIIVIGYFDYLTPVDLSCSLFYLIPISLLALLQNTKIAITLITTVFATIVCFLAEYYSRQGSSLFYPIWNSVVRLFIFSTPVILIWYLKEERKKQILANYKLGVINEEKSTIIGIAAHDLRNPISCIHSFSDLIIEDYGDNLQPEVVEAINNIKMTSKKTLVILNNLLNMSRIESGKVDLQLITQDYIQFVNHHILINQILAKHKNICIALCSDNECFAVEFDEHYLGEVMDNLLSNAIKYSNKNTEITVRVSLPNNNVILTEVIDNGLGIPEAEQHKLFNYFQTTSNRPTGEEQSTGLGLAIAKQIVMFHNGEIGLKSVLDQGSNFYFQFPIQQN